MPHFHIEYSPNLEQAVDMAGFCEVIRAEAARIEAIPLAGIRVRAMKVDHYAIADGNPDHGFIDISLRMRAGRSDEVKRDAITRIFAAAERHLAPVMATQGIALSAELREINPDLAPKTGTIRKYLRGDA